MQLHKYMNVKCSPEINKYKLNWKEILNSRHEKIQEKNL